MIESATPHLLASVSRLWCDVEAQHPVGGRPGPDDDVTGAAGTTARALQHLVDAVAEPGGASRDQTLALIERAELLEERLLRAVRETAASRRERLDRGLTELRACETTGALLDRVCSIAVRALDADRVAVGVVRDEAWSASRAATAGPTDPATASDIGGPRDVVDPATATAVVESGRAAATLVGDPAAAVLAPIQVGGRTVALLHVGPGPREPDQDDMGHGERFARVVGETFEVLDAAERLAEITRIAEHAANRLRSGVAGRPESDGVLPTPTVFDAPSAGSSAADHRAAARLTPRQRETLRLMLRGATNAEIAEALLISVPTVKGHVTAILRAVGAVNRAEAITRYLDGRP